MPGHLQTSIWSRFFFHQTVDLSKIASLVCRKLLCALALLVFEKQFHFGCDTSDLYMTMLNSSSMKTSLFTDLLFSQKIVERANPGSGTRKNGLHGEAPPESGTFFRLEVYKRHGFHELKYRKGR